MLLGPSGSVWKGGVKNRFLEDSWKIPGRFLELLQTAVYSNACAASPDEADATIRRSQQEDPGSFIMTGTQIKHLSPAALPGKLWEQNPSTPFLQQIKYLKLSFPGSQTLPSPHAL